jgi:hypothetical protein
MSVNLAGQKPVASTTTTLPAATTDWTFGGLWPFEPRWFETSDGRMH